MRRFCLKKWHSETLQNLPFFWNKKTQIDFFSFFISSNFGFVTVDVSQYFLQEFTKFFWHYLKQNLSSVNSLKELHASSSKISSVFRITFFRSRDHYHLVFFSVDVEVLIKYATAHPIKMEGLKSWSGKKRGSPLREKEEIVEGAEVSCCLLLLLL